MNETLFSRLASYSQNQKKQSIENFTTELLAYLINEDRAFHRAFIKQIIPDRMVRSFRNASATTQVYYSNGIVDLVLEDPRTQQKVLVEVKIGGNETLTKIDGQGLTPQVQKYLDYRKGYVAYLTTRDVPFPDVRKKAKRFLGQHYLDDIYQRLKNKKKLTEFTKEFLKFIGEKNMTTPEPFTLNDLRQARHAFLFAKKCTSILNKVKDEIAPKFRKMFKSGTSFTAPILSSSDESAYTYTKYRKGPIKYVELDLEPYDGKLYLATYLIIDIRHAHARQLEERLQRLKWESYENGKYLGSFIKLSGGDRDFIRMVNHVKKNLDQLHQTIS